VKNGCLQRLPFFLLLFVGVGFTLLTPAVHAQGPTIRYTYDDLGRLKQVIDQNGEIRTYNYDAVGNILSITADPDGCPIAAPVITGIQPESCLAGTTCQITIDGSGLEGAGISSSNPQAAISDCQTDCTQITCRLAPSPLMSPGPVNIVVTNSEGSIDILPPPTLGGPGQTDLWHFAANRGTAITLTMTRIPNQVNGSSSLGLQETVWVN
jgi:YD repeat-containing protein